MDPVALAAPAAVLLAVVGGLAARRRAHKPPKPATPEDRAVVRLLKALGHDPAQVLVQLVQQPRRKAGMRVLTKDGRPLRYYRLSELRRKQRDPGFRAAMAAVMARDAGA